jgi:polyisoprenoid-binding protein YceI
MLTERPPLKIVSLTIAAFGLALALTGCQSPTVSPAAAPTSAPAVRGGGPSTAATPLAATSVPAATADAAGTAAATTSAPRTAEPVTLVLEPSASQASYRAREQLAGRTLPSDAVGTSKAVSGNLVLAPDGSVSADQSKINVDLTKLQSDESRRDNWIKGNTLQTSRFPTATFVPREVQGLPTPLPRAGEATFMLSGDLTVHGVTKPVTWQVTAQFADSSVSGSATTNVKITDFGMTPPRVGPVLNIEDTLTLELAFTANRDA